MRQLRAEISTHTHRIFRRKLPNLLHSLEVGVKEEAGVVENQQAPHAPAPANVGGEAAGMLPCQVAQEAEAACQCLQEPEGHLPQG